MPQPIEKEHSSNVNKFDDILAYTEDILNSCDDVIDITEETKTKVPVMSLEDLKKKTDEILNSVASCGDALDAFLPKDKGPKVVFWASFFHFFIMIMYVGSRATSKRTHNMPSVS